MILFLIHSKFMYELTIQFRNSRKINDYDIKKI